MYSYLNDIKARLTDEDVKFLSEIYAPREVATMDEDAWRGLCVTPDGKIRFYGLHGKKSVFDHDAPKCYIESCDGGLSWKKHFAKEGALNQSVKVPFGKYKGKYMGFVYRDSDFHVAIAESPDDAPFFVSDALDKEVQHLGEDIRLPLFLAHRERVIILMHETNKKIHPTAYFCKVYYSDDCGETWTKVDPGIAPLFEKSWAHKGYRWQQNYRENTIAELSDGTLMMLARTSMDYHYVNYSHDGGETWTTPEPSVFHGTGTMPTFRRLSDGRIMLCWCNTKLLPELESADGVWEDVFTNRDANHCAITEDDGKTWKGFREMVLNHIRCNADFRSYGGPEASRDKSVHQFEILELPFNKVLVAYGQHYACRRIIIFDIDWLYEAKRTERFLYGLASLSTQTYVQSISGGHKGQPHNANEYVGHCAYNRTDSVLLVPNPHDFGREALSFKTNDDPRLLNNIGGAVWNFPIAKKGRITVRAALGGKGLRVSLTDHWMNPTDSSVEYFADFSMVLRSDMHPEGEEISDFVIEFDCEKDEATVFCGEYLSITRRMNNAHPNGICYLHLQTAAGMGESDPDGSLVARLDFEAL